MTPIVEIRFGSHLYGMTTARSDLGTKLVFLPPAGEILLRRGARRLPRKSRSSRFMGMPRWKQTARD